LNFIKLCQKGFAYPDDGLKKEWWRVFHDWWWKYGWVDVVCVDGFSFQDVVGENLDHLIDDERDNTAYFHDFDYY